MKLTDRIISSAFVVQLRYYLAVSIVPLAGLVLLQIFQWTSTPYPHRTSDGMLSLTLPSLYLLSVPCAFIVWLHTLRKEQDFRLHFSIPAGIISVGAFALAAMFHNKFHGYYAIGFALVGCIAGGFVFIRAKTFCAHAFRDRQKAIIALIASGCSAMYSVLDTHLWQQICTSTAFVTHKLLAFAGIENSVQIIPKGGSPMIMVVSEHFSLHIYRPCSGLEGIFIFMFLLSAVLLVDWKILKKLPLIELYLIGFIYMYLVNVLRIVSLFALGHHAWEPDASHFMASLKSLPLHIFHSFAGQVYYLIAFVIFIDLLYRYAGRPAKKP